MCKNFSELTGSFSLSSLLFPFLSSPRGVATGHVPDLEVLSLPNFTERDKGMQPQIFLTLSTKSTDNFQNLLIYTHPDNHYQKVIFKYIIFSKTSLFYKTSFEKAGKTFV